MSPIQSLVKDIEAAIDDQTSDRRVALLHRITNLFIEQMPDLNEEHIGVFDDVILCLALEIEFHARVELSERLADLDRAPRKTINNLALDTDIAIARPVLERSLCVGEDALLTVAGERKLEFLKALVRRRMISSPVTDLLIERGDDELILSLVENRQSSLSDHGLRLLAEKAVQDTRLYRVLKTRPDLATRHIGAILEAAKRRAKAEMRDLAANDDTLESALTTGTVAVLELLHGHAGATVHIHRAVRHRLPETGKNRRGPRHCLASCRNAAGHRSNRLWRRSIRPSPVHLPSIEF